MATTNSEDEIRREKVAAMGEELGELHFLLWKDLTWLHLEWQQYRELFGTNESRIDLMNRTAPRFFTSLERVLWQDVLLTLSRLADPAATGGQQNLTFRQLLLHITNPEMRFRFIEALNMYEAAARFARDWRHRRFAHRELSHASDAKTHSLIPASRASVERALQAARELMNLLEDELQGGETAYDHASDSGGGAVPLLWYLDSGLEVDEERRANGQWRPRFT
jgi:hypothetical protein